MTSKNTEPELEGLLATLAKDMLAPEMSRSAVHEVLRKAGVNQTELANKASTIVDMILTSAADPKVRRLRRMSRSELVSRVAALRANPAVGARVVARINRRDWRSLSDLELCAIVAEHSSDDDSDDE